MKTNKIWAYMSLFLALGIFATGVFMRKILSTNDMMLLLMAMYWNLEGYKEAVR